MIPTSDIKMYGLPRERPGNIITLPERSLEPTNNTPKFKNGYVQSDLQFSHYRSSSEDEPTEPVKFLNYNNYKSVCLAQNLDDLAKDVL